MSRLTTVIICIVLSAIFGFFLLRPQYQKFSDARWQVKKQEVERNNQEEYFAHIESLSKDLEGYEEQKKKILSAVPSRPDTPALLNFIANASSQNGMNLEKITSFSTSVSTDQTNQTLTTSSGNEAASISNMKEININFSVSGDYTSLKNFISTLERNARIIEIDSISLTKSTTQEKEGLPPFDFKIKAYY